MIWDLDGQHRVLRERRLDLKTPGDEELFKRKREFPFKNSLAKHRIELLGDIVLLVRNPLGPKVEDEVGVGLAVDVHGVQVVGLHHIGADQHSDWLVARKALR